MSSVLLLLHRKSLFKFVVLSNMSGVRLLQSLENQVKKLVKSDVLICLHSVRLLLHRKSLPERGTSMMSL